MQQVKPTARTLGKETQFVKFLPADVPAGPWPEGLDEGHRCLQHWASNPSKSFFGPGAIPTQYSGTFF